MVDVVVVELAGEVPGARLTQLLGLGVAELAALALGGESGVDGAAAVAAAAGDEGAGEDEEEGGACLLYTSDAADE